MEVYLTTVMDGFLYYDVFAFSTREKAEQKAAAILALEVERVEKRAGQYNLEELAEIKQALAREELSFAVAMWNVFSTDFTADHRSISYISVSQKTIDGE